MMAASEVDINTLKQPLDQRLVKNIEILEKVETLCYAATQITLQSEWLM